MNHVPKVLVVDDDPAVPKILRPYLADEGFTVLEARTGEDAIAIAERERPEVVLLDLQMPGVAGQDVLAELQRRRIETFVIFLTARGDEIDRVLGLELGADDYVAKPFSPREVVSRVKAVLRRAVLKRSDATTARDGGGPKTIVAGDVRLDLARRVVSVSERQATLTPTEFRILEVLASEPGRVFSRSELLDKVNRDSLEVMERSLDSHIAHLRQKIEPSPKPRYVLTVYGFGYKLGVPERAAALST